MAAQELSQEFDAVGELIAVGLIVNLIDQCVHKLAPDFMT
jgi:hypothetical protein|tara:strand:- start:1007 stop:1126 length:120 start_codon:yes stop_codon:yes gene_type:complete